MGISVLIILFPINLTSQCYEDRHNTDKSTAWLSCTAKQSPNIARGTGHWVMVELPDQYPMGNIHFWNYNHPDELDYGFKKVTIDLSIDGINWTEKADFTLAQAEASGYYEGITGPYLEGFPAKYILITAQSNYGGLCSGLAEIRITSSSDNPVFSFVEQTQDILCSGESTAEITVSAVGGNPPYSFSLDGINYQLENKFSNLSAGDYTAFTRDSDGTQSEDQYIEIKEPAPLVSSSIVNDTLLFISATGGTGQISFSLDNINFQASNQFTLDQNGMMMYYVKDQNECLDTFNFFSFIDLDDDGFNSDEDCNDLDATINILAEEVPNNDIDENCDGLIEVIDIDGDGFNSDEDCDDDNADINPIAIEIANNDIDENCDGVLLIIDLDGDGFNSDEDCDDDNPSIYPNAEEIPNNGIDENCDGVDYIIDNDGDGFNSDEDCDDFDATINTDAIEIPNNDIDENCDGIILIIDDDGDGFNSDEDCDDLNADIHPDAIEIPDNDIDENCDGIIEVTSSAIEQKPEFKIYPNPFSDHIFIELSDASHYSINIFDASGRIISSLPLMQQNNRIELSGLSTGNYILQLLNKNNSNQNSFEIIKISR